MPPSSGADASSDRGDKRMISAGKIVDRREPPLALTLLNWPNVTSLQRFCAVLPVTVIVMGISAGAQVVIGTNYPPYPAGASDSSLRIEVTPRDTEVFVDGYYAGVVDDFDGTFQRLHVEPGPHEIVLYHDGYRTATEHVYLAPDKTFKIKRALEKLPPGSSPEPRPVPPPPPADFGAPRPLPRGGPGNQSPGPPPPGPPSSRPPGNQTQRAEGQLLLHVQPSDADVLIDGQPWPAAPTQDRVVLDLPPGRHVIQVRKPGYVGYTTEVEVRSGETSNLDVTLRRQP